MRRKLTDRSLHRGSWADGGGIKALDEAHDGGWVEVAEVEVERNVVDAVSSRLADNLHHSAQRRRVADRRQIALKPQQVV